MSLKRDKILVQPGRSQMIKMPLSRNMSRTLVQMERQAAKDFSAHQRSLRDFGTMETQIDINKFYSDMDKAKEANDLPKAREIFKSFQKKLESRRALPKARKAKRIKQKELKTAVSQIKRGGTISRKSGGKVMYGYKAGGKV